MDFSIATITYNREKNLTEFLDSVLEQFLTPNELIIIDDGNLKENFLEEQKRRLKERNISFVYFKKYNKGTALSKNLALKLSKNKIVFIFDDDVILSKDYLEKIIDVWKNNKDNNLAGVGGVIENYREKNIFERVFNKIFLLDSKKSWDVTDLGFAVWDDHIKEIQKGYYLHGCLSSIKKEAGEEILFNQMSEGRDALEDVDFFFRAKKAGHFFLINPDAKIFHKQSRTSRDKDFLIGLKESRNRKIIFKKNVEKNFKNNILFFWSNIGWILRQVLVGNFSKASGMIKGII